MTTLNNLVRSRLNSIPTNLSLAPGATAAWFGETAKTPGRLAIPNALSSVPLSKSLIGPSRRNFLRQTGLSGWRSDGNVTITDNSVSGPDGTQQGSVVNASSGLWDLIACNNQGNASGLTLTSGNYTIGINSRSNVNTNQTFSFKIPGGQSSDKIATNSYQRFSVSFNFDSSVFSARFGLNNDGAQSGANLQICDFDFYSGTQDLAPLQPDGHYYNPPAGHFYFGFGTAGIETQKGSAIDLTAPYACGCMLLPAPVSISSFTLMLALKVNSASGLPSIVLQSPSHNILISLASNPSFQWINGIISGVNSPNIGLSNFTSTSSPFGGFGFHNGSEIPDGSNPLLGCGYKVIMLRSDGFSMELWIDDLLFSSNYYTNALYMNSWGDAPFSFDTLVLGSQTADGVSATNNFLFYGGAFWPTYLSTSQYFQSLDYFYSRMTQNGL